MKKNEMIPLYNDDFKLITGAMPVFDPDNPKHSHKVILKRIRDTFKINREKLEEIHEVRHQEQIKLATRMHASIGRWQSAYQTFKKTIMDKIKGGESVNNAIRAAFNTTWFTPEAIRGRANMWTAIKRDKELFKQLRRYTGWNKKINPDQLIWDDENKRYIYRGESGTATIEKIQSPKKGRGSIILRVSKLNEKKDNEDNIEEFIDFEHSAEVWEAIKVGVQGI